MPTDKLKAVEREDSASSDIHVVFPANPAREQLRALAADLRARRDAILDAWRAYGDVVPGQNIAASLSRVQFNDHIPRVLDSLSESLEAWPEGSNPNRRGDRG